MDTFASTNEAPVGPLRRRPMGQTREPREWRRDCSTIRKVRRQSIVAYTNAVGQCGPEFSFLHGNLSMHFNRFQNYVIVKHPPKGGAGPFAWPFLLNPEHTLK